MAYARELVVRYGGFNVGAGTSYELHGGINIEDTFTTARVSFSVLVASQVETTFGALCTALETAFRRPWQSLEVWQRQVRLASYHVGQGTALNPVPTIRKVESEANTGRSRLYEIMVEMGRPANNVPVTGLREYSVRASFDPSRRATIEIAGVWTRSGGSLAYAVYRGAVASLVSTVLAAYTGTFEIVAEEEGWDTNAALCPFRRVYEEVIFDQGGGGLADTSIVQQRLSITPAETDDWDFGQDQQRVKTVSARYSCSFDKSVVADMTTKEPTIRAFVLEKVAEIVGEQYWVVAAEDFTYHHDEHRCEASFTIWTTGSDAYYTREITVEDDDDRGVVIVPAWSSNPIEALVVAGPRVYRRVVTDRGMSASTQNVSTILAAIDKTFAANSANPSLASPATGGSWVVTHRSGHATPLQMQGTRNGEGGGGTLFATRYEARVEARWIKPYRAVTG
jgi:hypothetical protein